MARVKQINLQIGSGSPTVLEVGDVCTADFKDIPSPQASVKSCQDCLIAILNILKGSDESDAGA